MRGKLKRFAALLLAIAMAAGMLPQLVLPQVSAATAGAVTVKDPDAPTDANRTATRASNGDITFAKGAIQDGVEIPDGGLVSEEKAVEYYLGLSNKGCEQPLQNLSFEDPDLGFAAGCDGVSLGTYTLSGEVYLRSIGELYAILTDASGVKYKLTFTSANALQSFLTTVHVDGRAQDGLAKGESLVLYGIRYGIREETLADGVFANKAYIAADGLTGTAEFKVYAGDSRQYFQWAGKPIRTNIADLVGDTGMSAAQIVTVQPSTADGSTQDGRLLPDGIYRICYTADGNGDYVWGASSGNEIAMTSNGSTGVCDFYVEYVGGGYYTLCDVATGKYVELNINSGWYDSNSVRQNGPVTDNKLNIDDRIYLVEAGKNADGTPAITDNMKWKLDSQGGWTFKLRPYCDTTGTFAVDMDSANYSTSTLVHMWSNSSNTNWVFAALTPGKMYTTSERVLFWNYDTAGAHTEYYKITLNNGASTVLPVTVYVFDVQDNAYVLDYGLPVNLSDPDDGGFMNNDALKQSSISTQLILEGLTAQASYNPAKNGIAADVAPTLDAAYGDFSMQLTGEPTYRIASAKDSGYVLSINDAGSGEWSDTKPAGVADSDLETRTVYRYTDTVTNTSAAMNGWTLVSSQSVKTGTGSVTYASFPSGFDTGNALYAKYHKTPVTASNEIRNITTATTGYIFWHWCANNTSLSAPFWRVIGSYSGFIYNNTTYNTFHAWESSQSPEALGGVAYSQSSWASGQTYYTFYQPTDGSGPNPNAASASYCGDTYNWWMLPITTQTYDTYTNQYTWQQTSDWLTVQPEPAQGRTTESKTQYRTKSDVTVTAGINLVIQARDDTNLSQLWYINTQEDGTVVLVNVKSGMALEYSSEYNVTQQAPVNGSSAQKWNIVTDGDYKMIQASDGSLCAADSETGSVKDYLDINGAIIAQNQAVGLWYDNDGTNQLWSIDCTSEFTGLVFTPDRMMNGPSQAKVVFRVAEAGVTAGTSVGAVNIHNEVELFECITTVPASVVYYEDVSPAINYGEANVGVTIGSGNSGYQDANQAEEYGHDSHYVSQGATSGGGSTRLFTYKGQAAAASFKFQGTGFELVGRALANKPGIITVRVYDTANNNELVRNLSVFTEYNNNADAAAASDGEVVYQVPLITVGDLTAGREYLAEIHLTPSFDSDGWTTEYVSGATAAESYIILTHAATGRIWHQRFVEEGSGYTAVYYEVIDGAEDASTGTTVAPDARETVFYLDGIRIFNPMATQDGITTGYYTTAENGAVVYELRALMQKGQAAVAEYNSTDGLTLGFSTGVFVEDRQGVYGANAAATVEDMLLTGPNNEVYVDGFSKNKAVAFYVNPQTDVSAQTLQVGVRLVDRSSLYGMTSAFQDSAHLYYGVYDSATGSYGWTEVSDSEQGITGGAEQYYTVDPLAGGYVEGKGYLVLLRVEGGVLSFTGVKANGYSIAKPEGWSASWVDYDGGTIPEDIQQAHLSDLPKLGCFMQTKEVIPARAVSAGGMIELVVSLPEDSMAVTGDALRFKSVALDLNSAVTFSFKAEETVFDGWENPYVVFTKAIYDKQGNVVGQESETVYDYTTEGGLRIYSFCGITAMELGSEVTATICAEKDAAAYKGVTAKYSVLQYANAKLEGEDQGLKTLLVDLLNYGAAAQTFFGYNTANLVNAGLTAEQQSLATQAAPELTSCRSLVKNQGAVVHIQSCALDLEEKVAISFCLNLADYTGQVSDLYAVVSFAGGTVSIPGSSFIKRTGSGSLYDVSFDGLNAAQMREACSIEIHTGSDGACVSDTLTYSVESYASSAVSGAGALADLVTAMMKYGDATAAYFS